MNYYEHHIGDYAEATAHLTFVEDAAYSRMIRKYYATEKPLPGGCSGCPAAFVCPDEDEKEAIGHDPQRIFHSEEDGWHNARCDAECPGYREWGY